MDSTQKNNLGMAVLGLALTLGVIYVTFYVAGKAWKKA
jgi:hypothetical protein